MTLQRVKQNNFVCYC